MNQQPPELRILLMLATDRPQTVAFKLSRGQKSARALRAWMNRLAADLDAAGYHQHSHSAGTEAAEAERPAGGARASAPPCVLTRGGGAPSKAGGPLNACASHWARKQVNSQVREARECPSIHVRPL